MTDTYGTEPPDSDNGHDSGHDEILTPEQEPVHEPPSEYEFADDHSDAPGDEHEPFIGEPAVRRLTDEAVRVIMGSQIAKVIPIREIGFWYRALPRPVQ